MFVAASNASDKAKAAADFVCDGTADQEQINAAITLAASGPLGGAAVVLSEGEFNLTGDLNETPALIGQVGANTTGAGTVINVTAATSGPVVSAYHLANIDFWVTAAVGTVVQMVSTGPLREVGIGRFGGSIAVGVDLIDNCVVSGLNVDRAAIGVQATTGETSLLSNVFLTGCNVGVSVDTGAMVASSLSVEVIPLNGKGVVVDGGAVFTIASGHFSTIQAGTTGIDVVSGTLNTGAATDCVFNGTATDISGATPGVPVYESDADGTRIPIRDENGVIKGYIGWESNTTNGIGVWVGDADGLNDGDSPTFLVKQDGTAYMQNGDGDGYIYISPNSGSGLYMETSAGGYVNVGHNGGVYLEAVGANLYLDTNGLRAFSGTGIDGTDTPTTAAELADVLVNLGLIASHTIT